jgi:hypothetical protein
VDVREAKRKYTNYLCTNLIPKAMKQDEVKKETASDSVLCNLSEAITHNDGSTPEAGSKLG